MYDVSSLYRFFPIDFDRLETVRAALTNFGIQHSLSGLIILATEGLNATIAAPHDHEGQTLSSTALFERYLTQLFPTIAFEFKRSRCNKLPFKRFQVQIRTEIVESGRPDLIPKAVHNNHLTPAEWHATLELEKDVVVLDTRNRYETAVGTFEGALDPNIDKFNQFPDFLHSTTLPKDKKILMYCTGGIRCEKALLEMREQGYENVFQLQGGILRYLEEYPDGYFKGECFVFDHRVALDKRLTPSEKFHLCVHCGDPGEVVVDCLQCGKIARICATCNHIADRKSCSKNCAYHLRRVQDRQATCSR
jgi:UPF0176 protein